MRKKNAIKNVISNLLLQLITIVCGFIVPKMIIQRFGSNVNGLVSSITQFLSYIVFLESGIGPIIKSLLYKPIAENNKEKVESILKSAEKFFRIISKIFIVYIIVLSIFFPIIMNGQFEVVYTISLVIIISISTFMEYYLGMVYKLYLQANQKKYIISRVQIITTIINTIMVIVLIKMGANIQIVKLVSTSIFILRPIILSLYVKKVYNINLKNIEKVEEIEQKWDGLAQHIASIIHTNTDISILTIFSKISEVSVYSVYYMVIKGIKQVIEAISTALEDSFGDMLARGEKETLNKNFKMYEFIYYSISTILYGSTIILIVPFIKIYTLNIKDANYIRYAFAYILVLGEFIWGIRQPYNNLVKVAGHFRQTRNGAWLEAFINITISIILVIKYGLVGVAIGTLVAISIRTIEIIIYASKNILERKIKKDFKRIIITAIEFILIMFISNNLINIEAISYLEWIKYAIIVAFINSIVVIGINTIFYKEDLKNIVNKVKIK